MLIDINTAIDAARSRRNTSIEKHLAGKCKPAHFVVTQFRHRLHVLREDGAIYSVLYTTRQDRLGTVNTDGVRV